MDPLPIPIYILKKGDEVPKETCYLVTQNGVFLHKFTGFIESLVKVEGICFLESVRAQAVPHLPKIPVQTMAVVLAFFSEINKLMSSEANLLLHCKTRGRKSYRLTCPKQEVSPVSVDYDSSERIAGYQLVGTIHSHNTMSAFHSGTDKADESCFDGLHITIGRLDKLPLFSISCSVMVNGQRFILEPEEIVVGIRKEEVVESKKVECRIDTEPTCSNFLPALNFQLTSGGFFNRKIEIPVELYRLDAPPKNKRNLGSFPSEWLFKVRKRSFGTIKSKKTTPIDQKRREGK